mgnify:CR=1 FL=1
MIALLACLYASAADLTFEAQVPTEIYVDDNAVAKMYQPGALRTQVSMGMHTVRIFTNGESTTQTVDFQGRTEATVVIGRTGISWPQDILAVPVGDEAPEIEGRVVFRSVADEDVIVTVDRIRETLSPGEERVIVVGAGQHPMTVRNAEGTVIWVRGALHIRTDDTIVQLADGRMPEVLGAGGQFVADGG